MSPELMNGRKMSQYNTSLPQLKEIEELPAEIKY